MPSMEALLADLKASKPWFVSDATRDSAEALLYSQGTVGSCLVRPSSKPSCLALSHRAFVDMVGHALIFVKPNGTFQLETKSDSHATLDELLSSLEPDVDLATSQWSVVPKGRKMSLRESLGAVRSRSGDLLASVRSKNQSSTDSDSAVAELADIFPEVPRDDLLRALAACDYEMRQATELLLNKQISQTSRSGVGSRLVSSPATARVPGRGAPLKRGPAPLPTAPVSPRSPAPPAPGAIKLPAGPAPALSTSPAGGSTNWTASPPSSPRRGVLPGHQRSAPQPADPAKTPESAGSPRTTGTSPPSLGASGTAPTPSESPRETAPVEEKPSDLVIAEDGAVKAGSLDRLVERLTHERHADPRFVQQFLLTYRSFTTPAELLEKLQARYNLSPPAELVGNPDEIAKWKKRVQVPIRLRVVNVLRGWVSRLWVDFAADETLTAALIAFVEKDVTASNDTLAAGLMRQINKHKSGIRKSARAMFSDNAPKPLAPAQAIRPAVAGEPFVWEDYHLTELARQMTLIEYDLYRAVQPWELFETAWSKKDKEQRAPNVLKMVARFNAVSAWVRTEITRRKEIRERALTMQRLIDLADKCRQLNNLNSLAQIVSGLNSSPIHRMKRTWDAVPAARRAKFEQLASIMSTAHNYKSFRQYLHTCKPPCVPYLGMYLTDLTFIEDGCKKYTDGLVNFDKCHKLARVIQEVTQYQDTPYNLTKVDYLQQALCSLTSVSEDECYKASLELEPRRKEGDEDEHEGLNMQGSQLVVRRGRIDDPSVFAGPKLRRLLEGAELPANLEFVVKNSITLAEAKVRPVKDESSSFQVTGPTADERHTTKNYIFHTCEQGMDMIEWMQALLRSGASGDALEDSLASIPKRATEGDGVSDDVRAGFLYIRTAGNFLKSRYDRRWVVLDKKSGLLSMGYLRLPELDAGKIVAEMYASGGTVGGGSTGDLSALVGAGSPPTSGGLAQMCTCMFRCNGSPKPTRLFVCETCSTSAQEQVAVCLECIINCHDGHKTPLSIVPAASMTGGARCYCDRCVKRFRKELERIATDGDDDGDAETEGTGADGTDVDGMGGGIPGDPDTSGGSGFETERSNSQRGPSIRKMVSRKFGTAAKSLGVTSRKQGGRAQGGGPLGLAQRAEGATAVAPPSPGSSERFEGGKSPPASSPRAIGVSGRAAGDDVGTPVSAVSAARNAVGGGGGVASRFGSDASTASSAGTSGGGSRKGSAPLQSIGVAEALEGYTAVDANELTMSTGDRLIIFRKNASTGWWLCEQVGGPNRGARGWAPRDYLTVLDEGK